MEKKSKFNAFIEKLAGRISNIVLLGFFGLVCCLPIVTIGAAFTAENAAMSSYLLYEDKKPLKTFWSTFKEKFKLSTIIWLIHLLAIVILAFDFLYYWYGDTTIDTIAQAGIFSLIMVVAFELQMVFVVISQDLADTIGTVFSKAADIAFNCLLQSIFLLIIGIAIPIICVFLFPSFILVIPGVTTFLTWQIIPDMLKKYKFKKGNAQYHKEQRSKKGV